MRETVAIDCCAEAPGRFSRGYAIVVVDVIRATTSAVTALAGGRKCFVVSSVEAAFRQAGSLERPLLAGELAGVMPLGFDLNNSPAELALLGDVARPVILLSSSGTRLMCEAARCEAAYVACLRNYAAMAGYLMRSQGKVAVIGAQTREQFRKEDQLCCAWIARELMNAGYRAEDRKTEQLVQRWGNASPDACLNGNSAAFLRRSGQTKDLDFIFGHINDVDAVFSMQGNEITKAPPRPSWELPLEDPATRDNRPVAL